MIEIVESNYSKDGHSKTIIELVNQYSMDIMGNGNPLSNFVKTNLVKELEKRKEIHTVIAFVNGIAAGIGICIEGFSTFSCKPLLNIHDLFIKSSFRGKGISKLILQKIEEIALRFDCCKLTLEVLDRNIIGRKLYESFGFVQYELNPNSGQALFLEKKL